MAKGRKLPISRSERYLGSYGYAGNTHADNDVELREDDVWSMVDDVINNGGDHQSFNSDWSSRASVDGGKISRRSAGGVPTKGSAGGLSVAFQTKKIGIVHQFRGDSTRGHHVTASAPVNVPDWSNIYRVDSVELMHDSDDGSDEHDSDMVPPHEYLARSHRSAAKSVFEGLGRTLKGRDLSRVRDAVWSQTGFDG